MVAVGVLSQEVVEHRLPASGVDLGRRRQHTVKIKEHGIEGQERRAQVGHGGVLPGVRKCLGGSAGAKTGYCSPSGPGGTDLPPCVSLALSCERQSGDADLERNGLLPDRALGLTESRLDSAPPSFPASFRIKHSFARVVRHGSLFDLDRLPLSGTLSSSHRAARAPDNGSVRGPSPRRHPKP